LATARIAVPDLVSNSYFPAIAAIAAIALDLRDLPYYDPAISETALEGLNRFAHATGLSRHWVPYADVVAMSLRHLWTA
jgi:hypothetical protein